MTPHQYDVEELFDVELSIQEKFNRLKAYSKKGKYKSNDREKFKRQQAEAQVKQIAVYEDRKRDRAAKTVGKPQVGGYRKPVERALDVPKSRWAVQCPISSEELEALRLLYAQNSMESLLACIKPPC